MIALCLYKPPVTPCLFRTKIEHSIGTKKPRGARLLDAPSIVVEATVLKSDWRSCRRVLSRDWQYLTRDSRAATRRIRSILLQLSAGSCDAEIIPVQYRWFVASNALKGLVISRSLSYLAGNRLSRSRGSCVLGHGCIFSTTFIWTMAREIQ